MESTIRTTRNAIIAVSLAGALMGISPASFAASRGAGAGPQAVSDNPAASDVAARLNKKEFRNVKVDVDANGIATLSGTVDLYEYKVEADKRAHRAKGVSAVRNDIQVAGPTVSDDQLKSKLVEKLEYDQVGYGNVFDAISVDVQGGVVTLAGHALNYPAKDSALGLVSTYPGVKDVVDNIQVDPVSFMDERIRMEVARAIYGFPSLNHYAVDPAKPIRITVVNGHVQLDGIVDSQGDKETAFIRANAVPGVFSVKNNLLVANQPAEGQRSSVNQ
ncbi:MAG: BON domain-containing protein [Terracidiphilus sp.]|jgi:osmotically-inducible protein OsmY